jgi:hypothetical protein
MEPVEFVTLGCVDSFNNRRLRSSIGNIPPAEAEATYWACQEGQAIEHASNKTASGVSRAVHVENPRGGVRGVTSGKQSY